MWRGGRATSARRTGRSSSARESSGTQVETEAKHDGFEPGTSNAREICFGAKACDEFCHEKSAQLEMGVTGRPNSHLAGLLMFS